MKNKLYTLINMFTKLPIILTFLLIYIMIGTIALIYNIFTRNTNNVYWL